MQPRLVHSRFFSCEAQECAQMRHVRQGKRKIAEKSSVAVPDFLRKQSEVVGVTVQTDKGVFCLSNPTCQRQGFDEPETAWQKRPFFPSRTLFSDIAVDQ